MSSRGLAGARGVADRLVECILKSKSYLLVSRGRSSQYHRPGRRLWYSQHYNQSAVAESLRKGNAMMSGIVKYAVVGSISVLIAANSAFSTIGSLGLRDTALVFLGGLGAGGSCAGLYHQARRLRRRARASR